MSLPAELAAMQARVERVARDYGLTFFPVVFEMVDYAQMNQLAAYTGFPVRYPHWRFGMEMEQISKSYEYGLSKIYEMVINNDPTYAYLLEGNSLLDQKLVMAHVYGHADFFRNNIYFSHTNRKMIDATANHATRVRRYQDRHGIETVERFIDDCLAIEDLIDLQAAFRANYGLQEARSDEDARETRARGTIATEEYLDSFVNPPERLEDKRRREADEATARRRFPVQPVRDVLGFLLHHAPLDSWERDVLGIVRKESYYFLPQRQTKIMNEGWASYWHTTMLSRDLLEDSEVVDYADHHSGTTATAPGRINPYKIGIELFRDIEYRWNTGRFGREWDECDDMGQREHWNRPTGLGREKIFEVRRVHCDLTFLDEFLTAEFCARHKLFTFHKDRRKDAWVIASREFEQIKRALLFQLTNAGTPMIDVVDANFRNRGELLLAHRHDGIDLRHDWSLEVLSSLARIWRRPVHIETTLGGKAKRLGHDGEKATDEDIKDVAS